MTRRVWHQQGTHDLRKEVAVSACPKTATSASTAPTGPVGCWRIRLQLAKATIDGHQLAGGEAGGFQEEEDGFGDLFAGAFAAGGGGFDEPLDAGVGLIEGDDAGGD